VKRCRSSCTRAAHRGRKAAVAETLTEVARGIRRVGDRPDRRPEGRNVPKETEAGQASSLALTPPGPPLPRPSRLVIRCAGPAYRPHTHPSPAKFAESCRNPAGDVKREKGRRLRMLPGNGRLPVRTRRWASFGSSAQAEMVQAPCSATAARRAPKAMRSASSRKIARRSSPRTMTWWRVCSVSKRACRGMARDTRARVVKECSVPDYMSMDHLLPMDQVRTPPSTRLPPPSPRSRQNQEISLDAPFPPVLACRSTSSSGEVPPPAWPFPRSPIPGNSPCRLWPVSIFLPSVSCLKMIRERRTCRRHARIECIQGYIWTVAL